MYIQSSPSPNYLHKNLPVQTGMNIAEWNKFRHIVDPIDPTLIDSLQYGFCMGIDREHVVNIPHTNHKSAHAEFQVIDDFIYKHYQSGAILGPYTTNPFPVKMYPSPLQVATSSSNKKRAVIDMSYPDSTSINSAIPKDWGCIPGFDGEFRLPTHDKMCERVMSLEHPVMALTDLSAYYMQLPSDLNDAPYLCFAWRDELWVHRRLPFGCRSSCLHAQRVTDAVCAIHRHESTNHVEGYVDDFGQIDDETVADSAYSEFHWLLALLGFIVTVLKCERPGYLRVFLGLLYNMLARTLELPQEKLDRALALIDEWLHSDTVGKHKLEQLAGFLNHISSVVHAGRPFSAFIYDLIQSKTFPVVIDDELKLDLAMWKDFLTSSFTRVCSMKVSLDLPTDIIVAIAVKHNTCILKIGSCFYGYKIQASWSIPPHVMHFVAVWLITKYHIQAIAGQIVAISVPTLNAVKLINRSTSVCKQIRPLVRETWLRQAQADTRIKAVLGSANVTWLYEHFVYFETVDI